MAVVTQTGRVTRRERCATTIPELAARVERVRTPRELIIEESPLADWIYRGLTSLAETVIVCDPRRNALIAKAGDKDDPIDAEKLAQLARGGGRLLRVAWLRPRRPPARVPDRCLGDVQDRPQTGRSTRSRTADNTRTARAANRRQEQARPANVDRVRESAPQEANKNGAFTENVH
ncbi:MAG: hypothetical protein KAY37_12410 [Phycisphaerae bacterium]|nr:hypothetical protein [Phycisphaerae bacterium]